LVPSENPGVKLFRAGTIIFPKRGATIFQGKVGVLGSQAALDPNLMALVPLSERVLPQFVHWFVKAIGLWRFADTTSVPQLNHKHLKQIRIPTPSSDIQKHICSDLDDLIRCATATRTRIHASRSNQMSLINKMLQERGG
jgi:type I restriction enzyme S subunit